MFDQEIDHAPLVVLGPGLAAVGEAVFARVVAEEVVGVHHGHHRVEPRQVVQAAALLVGEGERLGDRQRFGDAGAFDDQTIETTLPCERRHLLQQILAQRAANAAVGHLDEFFLGSVEGRTAAFEERGVDVHLAHVVDDEGDPAVLAVVEQMVEQRGLSGSEEAGKHGHWKR